MAEEKNEDSAVRATALLRLTRDLATELHPHGHPPDTASLDSALDRDMGFDSLGRVELLARIEATFDVALPEKLLATAETPRDLLREILAADSRGREINVKKTDAIAASGVVGETAGEATAAPRSAETLLDVLAWHVRRHADRPHIRFYADDDIGDRDKDRGGDEDGNVITYGDLWHGAQQVAIGLQQRDVRAGDNIVIMLPTGREYFYSFFGTLLAGAVPVPIYPPARLTQIEEHLRRHATIIANCLAGILITVPEAKPLGGILRSRVEGLRAVVTVEELSAATGTLADQGLSPASTAFLQYTSGSTGAPKGVVLSHANLLSNIRALGDVIRPTPDDVFVSWLPLYHDMGLIGAWLGSLYFAVPLVIMPPLSFLGRPQRWLSAIHRYGGTISAAPNFAYEQCLNRIHDRDIEGLDLGTWRLAFNGAEAVSPDTVRRFCARFADKGFRQSSMYPVYGLAESSVGLALPPLGRGPVIDRIERATFQQTGNAVPISGAARVSADENTADNIDETTAPILEFVRCGHPLPGHQIRIVDAIGHELPERREGRLQFCGPSSTAGYFRNADETARLFDGNWLESGDLAYIAGGDVCITGRIKDVVMRAGRNIYPAELEDAIGDIEGIRKGNVAVFGSTDTRTATERLVILAETRKRDDDAQARLRAAINALAADLIDAPPDDVVLAPPNTVLKTSSGKIRRAATKAIYEQGLVDQPRRGVKWQLMRLSLGAAMGRGRRRLQAVATGLYAAYTWLVLCLTLPIVWPTVVLLPRRAWRWTFLHAALRLIFRVLGITVTVRGLDNLPSSSQAWMIVSNHASYLDSPLLIAALPMPLRFAAKGELLGNFFTRHFLQRLGTEFVDRSDTQKGIDDARRITANVTPGAPLVFFPEGTLTRMPGLLPFHMGAFQIASEAGLPVVPVVIRGSRSVLRDESPIPHPGAIQITVGPPIAIETAAAANTWSTAIALRNAARAHILRHNDEPDLGHERPEF